MYLRPSTKWNEYLLAEAIENIGLPSRVVSYLKTRARFTITGDRRARSYAERRGIELTPLTDKMLTWLGLLVKKFPMMLFNREDAQHVANFIKKEVQASDPEGDREARGERMIDAIAPLLEVPPTHAPEILNQTLADIKSLRKRVLRAATKADLSEDFAHKVGTVFDHRVVQHVKDNDSLRVMVRDILIALAVDPYIYDEQLNDASELAVARMAARDFLENPAKDPEQVIHEFDNGYFWYDIRSHHCDFEAKEMGHCGSGTDGALVSLRSGKKRKMKPFITMEFAEDTIYQIKAKANRAPTKELWPYIDWFFENMGVKKVAEFGQGSDDGLGFAEMLTYLEKKHPDIRFGEPWAREADELLDQYEAGIETDTQTSLELDYASEGDDEEVGVVLTHQAYWPILDKVVDEESDRLVWDITQDATSIAEEALYPNPSHVRAAVFRRGEQDSRTAMLRIELWWSRSFEPADPQDEASVNKQLEHLAEFLAEMEEISGYLISSESAPEDANFDYNEFWEGIEKRLQEYGVYRDVAAEIDAEDEREKSGQLALPLQETKRPEPDWFAQAALLRERRIIQRWQQIIK